MRPLLLLLVAGVVGCGLRGLCAGETQPWSIPHAALRGNTNVVEMLAKMGSNVNEPGPDGNTPLHNAALKGYLPVVRVLLQYGARTDVLSRTGTFPLHDAAAGGNAEIVRALVAKGADVNCRTRESRETPLHAAAAWGRVEVIAALLDAGAVLNLLDGKGRTPLDAAKLHDQSEAVRVLSSRMRASPR